MNTYTPTQLLAAIWCAVGAPSAALAQQPALTAPFEVFAGPTYWHVNAGSWGAHLGAGLRFPAQGRQLSVAAVVFHGLARSDSTNPSVTSVELEASLAVAMVRRRAQTNLFLSFGIGRTHIDASRQNGALAGCTPQNFCMAEGVTLYRTGTRWMWVPGLGLELPVSPALALRPHVRVLLPRDGNATGAHAMALLDLAIQLRP